MPRYSTVLSAALLVFGLIGCSDDSPSEINCDTDQLYDQVNDRCVPRGGLSEADTDVSDAGSDTDPQDVEQDVEDVEEDSGADTGDASEDTDTIDMEECDKDNDGAIDEACGGYDCDDNDARRSPYHTEICDEIDNNCSDTVNDYIDCTFYAHTGEDLYTIDPFEKKATKLGGDLPYLQDIDTHPDGTLFGITRDGIYRLDTWADAWVMQGEFGVDIGDTNGLAIDSDGTAYITSEDKIYTAELRTGQATLLGSTGDFYSSGDCVVNKRDTLYMTSKEEGEPDKLIQVSRETATGTAIGEVGFDRVFALTAAWGTLYGLTSEGELIEINQQTGSANLVHTFNGISFWGAASTPNR